MAAEGQQRTSGEEVRRPGGRLPARIDDEPGRDLQALGPGHPQLALRDPGRGEVEDQRAIRGAGCGPGERIGAERAAGAAERGDDRPGVAEGQAHQSGAGQFGDVLTQPPDVVAVTDGHRRHAMLAGQFGGEPGSELGGWLAETPAAIHGGGGPLLPGDGGGRRRADLPVRDPGRVLGQPDHPVRVMTHEVGQDQGPRHLRRRFPPGFRAAVSARSARVTSSSGENRQRPASSFDLVIC